MPIGVSMAQGVFIQRFYRKIAFFSGICRCFCAIRHKKSAGNIRKKCGQTQVVTAFEPVIKLFDPCSVPKAWHMMRESFSETE